VATSKASKPISLLRLTTAARELNVSESTLRRYADTGKLPHLRDSAGQRLFVMADLVNFRERRSK